MNNNSNALSGLTIIDCSSLRTGPSITKFFCDNGAKVIKIEHPTQGDPAKKWPEVYTSLNSGKDILALDLKTQQGQTNFHQLVTQANALVESYIPATKIKLGLTSNIIHSINPNTVILSLTGYPKNSPRYEEPAHDLNIQAASGLLSLFNELPGLPLADLFTSNLAIQKLLLGLYSKQPFQVIHFSFLEALKTIQSTAIAEYEACHILPNHGETLVTGKYPCYNIYTTADYKKITVAALEKHYWENFCRAIDNSNLIEQQYSSQAIESVRKIIAQKNWMDWELILKKQPCCVERVLSYSELLNAEEVSRNGL